MNVRQDALSDVNDNDILYLEEFPSYNEAVRKMNKVKNLILMEDAVIMI